jgi:hypothetical protein
MSRLAEILKERRVAERIAMAKVSSLVAALSAQNDALSEQKDTLSAQIETLALQNDTFSEKIETLTSQNATLSEQNANLSKQNETLATEKNALKQQDATKYQEFMTQKEAWSKEKAMLVERQDEQDVYIDNMEAQHEQKLNTARAEHKCRYKLFLQHQSLLRAQVAEYEKSEREQLRAQTQALLERTTRFKQQDLEAQALTDMIGEASHTT